MMVLSSNKPQVCYGPEHRDIHRLFYLSSVTSQGPKSWDEASGLFSEIRVPSWLLRFSLLLSHVLSPIA
jgi:hypothetical protein